ncbi:hypothetical protein [Prauserella muralis]|uniref:Uncharacterized protein n=1 Tax=Prauserella muralis TaxID=588067 RepID=A0A2V4B5B0_9PSEU|nr:hypothetical protein [Prauserella muralis]PXY28255.1 hypothetical protein BAY60_18215 [Prauserella muralis]TWE27424.1 hypothetical protein FHX69_0047 [Prauserella muralis]
MEQLRQVVVGSSVALVILLGGMFVIALVAVAIVWTMRRRARRLDSDPSCAELRRFLPADATAPADTTAPVREHVDPLSAEADAVRQLLAGEIDRAAYRARMREVALKPAQRRGHLRRKQ